MCIYGYGKSFHFDHKLGLDSIKDNLMELEGEVIQEIVVGSTGSFFDNHEVPAALRREIYRLLADVDIENLCFETR